MWYLKRLAERAGARLGGAFEHGLGEIIYTDQQQSWRLLKEFTRNSHARGWGRGGSLTLALRIHVRLGALRSPWALYQPTNKQEIT